MNDYIKNYPHGQSVSLKDYADTVGATNFNFRIGGICRVDQLCNGVRGQDWYALIAAQRWSTHMNQAFRAVAFASTIAMEITQSMAFDFIPAPTHIMEYISTSISAVFWVILALPGVWFGPVGKYYYRAVLSVFYATTGIVRPISTFLYPTSSRAFTQWSDIAWLMTRVQRDVQQTMINITETVKKAPISSDEGLYGLNHDGNLFSDRPIQTESEYQATFDKAFRLQALSHLWRSENLFITRGSDPCNGDGENGAWTGRDVISYCSPDGIMMNVIQAKGKHARSKIFGGHRVLEKYNFTAEFLTTTAWECQQKVGGVVEPTTWHNATDTELSSLLSNECMFTLPICDLTQPSIKAERDRGSGTVEACRKIGKLKI
ncbi:hypothetical protein CROQUDRAFT_667676 [Cronartium quercuum f. sp. fusiforme G11]|uniref:DUF7872 domain-containing protein n=1 Tax=Cronartium quercuum f. sp. fusiforme G11 TaxID=708437 RepID=A0A9P6NZ17_9BASI|nr:hypothetical protein CROQUDRAFT_667676 [Cronartium quercuum f. sp. fusiforme G11]